MSSLLAQAHTAHRQVGTYLAERVSALEVDVEKSRRTLAAVLAQNPEERRSSTQSSVLGSIGLCIGNNSTLEGNMRHGEVEGREDPRGEGSHFTGGVQEAMVRADISRR